MVKPVDGLITQKNGNLMIKCFCLIKIKKSLTALADVTLVSLSHTHTVAL